MEALRDLALADYENLPDDNKRGLRGLFNEMVAQGKDFSEYFKNYNTDTSPPTLPDSCDIYKKKSLDFEEFITLTYIFDRGETVLIVCKGCKSLITGKPYFICNDCFNDVTSGRSFNLCCQCYRSKNFKDHQHTSFISNLSKLFDCRLGAAMRENEVKKRNKFIDRALIEFGREFKEFAKSIATQPFAWEHSFGKGFEDEKVDEKEEENSSMSRPQGSRNTYVDLLGLKATDVISWD